MIFLAELRNQQVGPEADTKSDSERLANQVRESLLATVIKTL